MTPSPVLPFVLASTLLQQLQAILDRAAPPCQHLGEHIRLLATRFLTQPVTPEATLDFETQLRQLLDECGRQIVQVVFNHIEPERPQDAPKHRQRDGQDYCRKNHKSPLRGSLATVFGPIVLQRCLYEPLEEARTDGQRAFAPLECCLGIVAGNATPALAERVGWLASQHSQQEVLDIVRRDYHVAWSTQVVRQVTAAVSAGIAPYLQAARQKRLLGWLTQAQHSRGRHRILLCVGRDGIMLPLRGEPNYKEGAVATLSVHDRRGRRLGTVYLGEMPEPYQVTLSDGLTTLLQGVLAAWTGALPRLAYVTDAGYHPTTYFDEVLSQLENPRRAGQCLDWTRVVDYYHASGYVSRLGELLFADGPARQAWVRRMRRLVLEKDHGVLRVLHSAAYYHVEKVLVSKDEKSYWEAYDYLLKHKAWMEYRQYRRAGIPLGSGVTEAACKTVFTQRFKESGMTWGHEGGEVILRLRLAALSGVWSEVYREYLRNRPLVSLAPQEAFPEECGENVA